MLFLSSMEIVKALIDLARAKGKYIVTNNLCSKLMCNCAIKYINGLDLWSRSLNHTTTSNFKSRIDGIQDCL